MRTARRGSIPITWSLPIERHQGLVELARRRSDLFNPSSMSRLAGNWYRVRRRRSPVPCGLTLRWLASKASPRVITAHRIRAFLLASAPTAFCHAERSRSASAHCEILSCRRCAVITSETRTPGRPSSSLRGSASFENSAEPSEDHTHASHSSARRVLFGARAALRMVAIWGFSGSGKHGVDSRIPACGRPACTRVCHGVQSKPDASRKNAGHRTSQAHRCLAGRSGCNRSRCTTRSYAMRLKTPSLNRVPRSRRIVDRSLRGRCALSATRALIGLACPPVAIALRWSS